MLNQVRYFQAVVRLGSFTEAAEECHISQSAISQQIKALEQELGVQLFVRMNRKFELTPAGEYFYKKSLVIVADYDRLVQDVIRISRKDHAELRIGYLKSYAGQAIQTAVAHFSEKYPDVNVYIVSGSHEDLYDALRAEKVDLVMSDQRRAFSDEYVNCSLAYVNCCIEIASRNPISVLETVSSGDLKNTPCILVASTSQQKTEAGYYSDIFGFHGDFLFADSIDEARLMVVQNNGFMPIDEVAEPFGNTTTRRIPLCRRERPITQHYCAFWKTDNSGYYVEEFAQILKSTFSQKE
ncbi:MAG: LysR family transcriptional regulator [Lachnospiraceae bacterium]|nr:LysR family transcriptional regulator [Lachnospiraceae bacterium]